MESVQKIVCVRVTKEERDSIRLRVKEAQSGKLQVLINSARNARLVKRSLAIAKQSPKRQRLHPLNYISLPLEIHSSDALSV